MGCPAVGTEQFDGRTDERSVTLVEQPVAGRAVVPGAHVEKGVERAQAAFDVADAQAIEPTSLELDDLPAANSTLESKRLLREASPMAQDAMKSTEPVAVHDPIVA